MIRSILSLFLIFSTITKGFTSAGDDLPLLSEQRAERIVIRTSQGLRAFLEEPSPYPRSDFNTYMAARSLAKTYAPDLPQSEVEETLKTLERLLGEKSFTPNRHELYTFYLARWTNMPRFQEKVETLLAHEDFLFPSPKPPKQPNESLYSPYALDSLAQRNNFSVYDRSVLLPEYLILSHEELTNRIALLVPQQHSLYSHAYGPIFSRIRAHMVHGLISMDPNLMKDRLAYALSTLEEHSSADPFTNMAMLTTYASRDPALQTASLEEMSKKLPFLMPDVTLGTGLYLFRKGVCSTLSLEKIDLFSQPEAQIFFTDCSDLTQSPWSKSLTGQQYLELNNFLLQMPQDKILPLAETFLGVPELHMIPTHTLRDIALSLSELSVEQLQTLVSCKEALFTSGMTPNDIKNFIIFRSFSQLQIRATARLMKEIPMVEPFSVENWVSIPKLVFYHLGSEQTRAVLSEEASIFMANLGQHARPVFIFEGIKDLEGDKLSTFFAHGLPLFPAPLNDDPLYMRETTTQIRELEADEIPLLVQEVTSFGEPPSSPRIAHSVESLLTVRLNSPRGSALNETLVR